MMQVVKENKTDKVRKIINERNFRGGHYCYSLDLISEVKDGPYKIRNILNGVKEVTFYIVYDKDPLIVMPIERKGNTISLLGVDEYFDYVDIIYRTDIDDSILKEAIKKLFETYKELGIKKIIWNYLPNDSKTKYLLSLNNYLPNKEVDNVYICFEDYESYFNSLSRNTRQNLRKAEHRLEKNNKEYKLVTNYKNLIDDDIINQCIDIYFKRQKDKYGKSILNQLAIKTINYSTTMMKKQKGLIMALMIDNKVVSFMFGYINLEDKSYEVPKIAIDSDFGFYSPGDVLINKAIEYFVLNTDIRKLDLCRGKEIYKMRMGGTVYKTYNYSIDL